MKRLTYNRLAGAGIRANRRSYLSLCAGIFASIFLVCSVVLSVFAGFSGYLDSLDRANGRQDAIAFDVSEEAARKITAISERTGFCTIVGQCEGFGVGWYDEAAADLACRQMFEGRLPESSGELAADLTVLTRLAPNAEPGDTLSLTITPFGGEPEAREYTLTGILQPQQAMEEMASWEPFPDDRFAMPQLVVASSEPAFPTGSVVRNLYLTTAERDTIDVAFATADRRLYAFDPFGYPISPDEPIWKYTQFRDSDLLTIFWNDTPLLQYIVILGGCLLVFALFGIGSAMDGQLERKKEEIGMLRAVGATRRQIRKIFGRESWIIALILSPAAVGLSVLLEYLLCRLAPKTFRFSLPPMAVGLMVVLSAAAIMAASFVPLWRSANQHPMGIIRDTKSLRRAKRLRSRTSFRPSVLVQLRKLRLHPLRYISGAVLAALLCVAVVISSMLGRYAVQVIARAPANYDFAIHKWSWSAFPDLRTPISKVQLSEADFAQLRSLPHVEQIEGLWEVSAIWDAGEPLPYLDDCMENHAFMFDTTIDQVIYEQAAEVLQSTGHLYHINIIVTTKPDTLTKHLTSGTIDRAALDAGQQVLFVGPDYYVKNFSAVQYACHVQPMPDIDYERVIRNDSVTAGMTVDLHQFAEDLAGFTGSSMEAEEIAAYYRNSDHRQGQAQIGGILGSSFWTDAHASGGIIHPEPAFITTPEGLASMGLLHSEITSVEIYLDGDVNESTEAYLENRITRIANRGDELAVENQLAMNRENRQSASTALVICGSVLALFLWISVSIISGSVARQMQAEKKTIGTLRALGMEERRLLAGYAGQAAVTLLLGMIFASPAFAFVGGIADLLLCLGGMLLISAVALLLCRWRIGRIGKKLLRESVIDNIREV